MPITVGDGQVVSPTTGNILGGSGTVSSGGIVTGGAYGDTGISTAMNEMQTVGDGSDLIGGLPEGWVGSYQWMQPWHVNVSTAYAEEQYYEGAQFSIRAQLSPDEQEWVQQQLIIGGYLSTDQVRAGGHWDINTYDAFYDLLAEANMNGYTWEQQLNLASRYGAQRMQQPGGGGGRRRGGGGAGRSVQISNSDDLRLAFRQATTSMTGGIFVDDGQIDAMVKAYQQIERQKQQQAMAGAAEIEAPPSTDAFAQTKLEEIDQGGIEANRFAQYTQMLEEMVGAV